MDWPELIEVRDLEHFEAVIGDTAECEVAVGFGVESVPDAEDDFNEGGTEEP